MLGEFEVMKREETESKVSVVTEAVGHALEGFDCVVDAFYGACRDRFVKEGQDAVTMGIHCIRHFNKFRDQ